MGSELFVMRGSILAACCALLAACLPAEGEPPVGTIILSSMSGTSAHLVGGDHTFAIAARELRPPSQDPAGTTHVLRFDFPPLWSPIPRQSVVAFDADWAGPIFDPHPWEDYLPVPGVHWLSVARGTLRAYSFSGDSVTAHLVRYWHGQCAISQPWGFLFQKMSDHLFDGIVNQAAGVQIPVLFFDVEVDWVTRAYDEFQPTFIGYATYIEHGFIFDAWYQMKAGVSVVDVTMNPAYVLDVKNSNGLVEVTNTHLGVVVYNGPISVKQGFQAALGSAVPAGLELAVAQALTTSLENPIFDVSCDSGAALSAQQEACYGLLREVQPGESYSHAEKLFRAAMLAAGFDQQGAAYLAARMAAALEAKNFSCEESQAGGGRCALHPVVERVNVLPDEFELVIAGEEAYGPPIEADKALLYRLLPWVLSYLGQPMPPGLACDQPIGAPGGELESHEHGSATVDF